MKKFSIADSLVNDGDEAGWLMTYADLMTLLLVFFVLLYSLTSFDTEKFKYTIESLKIQFQTDESIMGLLELIEIPDTADTQITIEDITGLRSRDASLFKDINKFVASKDQGDNIGTHILDGKIIVRINGSALFNSGSATLKNSALPILDQIITIMYDYFDYTINIKGHTDNVPISTPRFPSNWELSAIRATTVLKHMIRKGIQPKRLTATGYGEIDPLLPNTSTENRATNRRVEFVLEKTAVR